MDKISGTVIFIGAVVLAIGILLLFIRSGGGKKK